MIRWSFWFFGIFGLFVVFCFVGFGFVSVFFFPLKTQIKMLMKYFKTFKDLDLSLFRYNLLFIQAVVCIYSTPICKSGSNICSFILRRTISKYYRESKICAQQKY